MGQVYFQQIQLTEYCCVVGLLIAIIKYEELIILVYVPDVIHTLSFGYVFIVLRGVGLLDVRAYLQREGVPEEKIVFVYERDIARLSNDYAFPIDVEGGPCAFALTD